MEQGKDALGPNNGAWNPLNPPPDGKVVVKCGNAHLYQRPSQTGWFDRDFLPMQAIVLSGPGLANTKPCSQTSGELARTYTTGYSSGNRPRQVIMLCDGWLNAALSKPATLDTRWATTDWTDVAFGRFAHEAVSVTILHEAMHCILPSSRGGSCKRYQSIR